jgi:uncharacterized protein
MQKHNLAILLSLLIFGCSHQVTAQYPQKMQIVQTQSLPITAKVTLKGRLIKLEVAKTSQEQATGLMNRTRLASNRGMLFIFDPPRPVGFWMKNTLIPLDMLFIRNGVIQAIAANVPPCKSDPCPSYSPGQIDIDQVLELKAGRAKELGVKPGDPIEIEYLTTRDHR